MGLRICVFGLQGPGFNVQGLVVTVRRTQSHFCQGAFVGYLMVLLVSNAFCLQGLLRYSQSFLQIRLYSHGLPTSESLVLVSRA